MQKLTIIFLIFLLAGCSAPVLTPIPSVTPTVTEEMLPTQTSTAIVTLQPTNTPMPTITNSPTPTPEWMRYQCLDILTRLPADKPLNDRIVYAIESFDAYINQGLSKAMIRLPKEEGDRLLSFHVSPDRKHILYRQVGPIQPGQKSIYVIADANGQPIWSAPDITKLLYYWFDGQHLLEWKVNSPALPDVTLVNPFTGERQELPTDFPHFNFDEVNYSIDFPYYWNRPDLVFNPTFTQVIYPEMDNWEGGFPVTLWDLEKDQPVARLLTQDTFGGNPIWIHNGEQFLIGMRTDMENQLFANEFFLVSKDGQIQQITHFTEILQTIEINHSYSLSPDERMVAFWITAQPGPFEDDRLAVLDLETGMVTNYCITGDPFHQKASDDSLLEPIWSPDSTQMLVVSRDPEDTSIRRIILVDVMEGWAAQIGTEAEPVGWMVSP
jgi:hypothetical protein